MLRSKTKLRHMRAYVYTHCTLQGAAILQAVDDSEIHAYIHIYIEAHWESTGHLLIPLVLPLPRVLDIAWCVGTSLQILQRGLLLATLQVCSLVGSLQSGLLLAMLPVCSLFGSLGRIVEESSVGLISQVVPNLYIAAPLACACRHSVLCAHNVSSGAEQRPEHTHHPVVRLEPRALGRRQAGRWA
jgi:hypothetical protein